MAASGIEPVGVLSLQGETTALVWLRAANNPWAAPDPASVSGVSLAGLRAGEWTLEWLDPITGSTTEGGSVTVAGLTSTFPVPAFHGEIALRATFAATLDGPSTDPAPTPPPIAVPAVVAVPPFTG